ncbi:MAG: translation initiation factor IF-2 subunit beta [Candidatus Rehaiarchaeum fermentans]|nr:translation initiation factor IF-2 subunit beta [Candidatus Rehaiarchaeum fermentans]
MEVDKEYLKLLDRIYESKKKIEKGRFNPPGVRVETTSQKTFIYLNDFANYIKRPINHIFRFLLHEFLTSGSIEKERIMLTGRFQPKQVQEKLQLYLQKYVYCKVCSSPDTEMIKEDKIYVIKCLACGASYPAEEIR